VPTQRREKTSSVLKQTPEIYYNWVASNYSLRGVAASLTHENNLALSTPQHYELGLFRMQRAGQWERMEPVLRFVEEKASFPATEKMYGFFLMALLKKQQYQRITQFFNEEIRGKQELMSPQNINIYLLSLAREGQVNTLLSDLSELQEQGFVPSEYTYHAIVEGHMIARQYKEASKAVMQMKEQGVEPTVQTYTIMVDWYARHDMPGRAEKTIERMRQEGLTPNTVTYTALIHGLSINKKHVEGFEWIRKLYDQNLAQPNLRTYTTLIRSFDESRQFGYVLRLWKMLQEDEKIEVPKMTHNWIQKIIRKAGVSLTEVL